MVVKKKKIDHKRLTSAQVEFITNKVLELGSIRRVEKFYSKKDTVASFAWLVARSIYGGGRDGQ